MKESIIFFAAWIITISLWLATGLLCILFLEKGDD